MLLLPMAWIDCVIMEPQYPRSSVIKAPGLICWPEFNLLGFNYRMTEFQAAVGLVQLGKLDTFIEERRRWANFYHERLSTYHG